MEREPSILLYQVYIEDFAIDSIKSCYQLFRILEDLTEQLQPDFDKPLVPVWKTDVA